MTVGSVDDGKSTLIGRLLHDTESIYVDQLRAVESASARLRRDGVDLAMVTDGLRAEREQGITIDVAYRHFATPRRRFIIADTPGHVQYTRNMATGASTADLAVLLVDARNGLTTQTRRHAFIASLLGLRHLVLVVNKMDAVGYDRDVFQRLADEFQEFAARLRFTDLRCIPVSALAGDNVVARSERMPWYQGAPLLEHLETVYVGGDRNLVDLRVSVQRVVRAGPDFRGYAGQVVSGVLRAGDEVIALPSGRRSRVAELVGFDGPRAYAFPPQAVTVVLADEIDVGRGDVLVRPANRPPLRREVEAMMVWLAEAPLRPGAPYLVKHLAAQTRATVRELSYRVDPDTLHREPAATLQLNEIGRVSLQVFRPLPADAYDRNRATGSFILIDPLDNATVGAGMIIDRAGGEAAGDGGPLTAARRAARFGQLPATIWLSGPDAAAVGRDLERRLFELGHAAFFLEGEDVAEAARLLNEAGLIVVVAAAAVPARARALIGAERLVEVAAAAGDALIEALEQRGFLPPSR